MDQFNPEILARGQQIGIPLAYEPNNPTQQATVGKQDGLYQKEQECLSYGNEKSAEGKLEDAYRSKEGAHRDAHGHLI